jgi:ribosomal protein S18 acetylase RimI-like enzyme
MSRPEIEIVEGLSERSELDDAAMVAARAFHTDPFYIHLAPPSLLRARGLAIFARSLLRNLGPKGRIFTARVEGRIVGVAGWVEPGGYPYGARQQIGQTAGVLRAFAPQPRAARPGFAYMRAIEKAHPKDELWYLALLTVDPEHQRSGVGSMLLGPVIDRCTTEGLDAYLETQKEDNLAYYRRHGFEVVDRLEPIADGPPLWTMRRVSRG